MSERAKTVGNNKGSPRSELIVYQPNTAANNIKRCRISKKADSVWFIMARKNEAELRILQAFYMQNPVLYVHGF